MSALADGLRELAAGTETIHDDDDLVMVWSMTSFAVLTRCSAIDPPHWHGALYGEAMTVRSNGVDAADAYQNLHSKCMELLDAVQDIQADARERSPAETTGGPGAEDVPDNHAGDGR